LESQAARRWFNLLDELDWVAYTFDPVYGPTKDFNFDYAAGKGARVIAEVLAHPRGHELAQPRQYPCPRCWGTGKPGVLGQHGRRLVGLPDLSGHRQARRPAQTPNWSRELVTAPDTHKSSTITDHPFTPRTEATLALPMYHGFVTVDPEHRKRLPPNPYLCGHPGCNLAESAHETTTN
jgi:hypothetical protein